MKTPLLLLALLTFPLCLLCGCAWTLPVPPKISNKQSEILMGIEHSLPKHTTTFAALLKKVGQYSHYPKKTNVARAPLNDVTAARAFAAGVSEIDLRDAAVREYAFLDAVSGRVFFCWRVFVRDGLVIYIEHTPISESDFRYYFDVPK